MQLSTLKAVVCPRCAGTAEPSPALSIDATDVEPQYAKEELVEGIITCSLCEQQYPIIAGVLVIVPSLASYFRSNYSSIIAQACACSTVSDGMIDYLIRRGFHTGRSDARDYYSSPRKVSTYINGGYDNLAGVMDSSDSLSNWFSTEYRCFYDEMLTMCLDSKASLPNHLFALDVGCYVGSFCSRIGRSMQHIYGVDMAFGGVLAARRIHFETPAPLKEYELFIDGSRSCKRSLSTPLPISGDFVVADARALPFRSGFFGFISSLNLLELVKHPREYLSEIRRVGENGASVLITTPYYWEEEEVAVEEWIENKLSSADAVRELLCSHGMDIISEKLHVPWVLRYNSRAYMTFLVHALLLCLAHETTRNDL